MPSPHPPPQDGSRISLEGQHQIPTGLGLRSRQAQQQCGSPAHVGPALHGFQGPDTPSTHSKILSKHSSGPGAGIASEPRWSGSKVGNGADLLVCISLTWRTALTVLPCPGQSMETRGAMAWGWSHEIWQAAQTSMCTCREGGFMYKCELQQKVWAGPVHLRVNKCPFLKATAVT